MMGVPPSPGALDGIRVVSVGQILAAPFCSTLLAEFGAEVIKVEPPGVGDPNRGNVSFAQDNRGQKSVTLNLHAPRARHSSASCATAPTFLSRTFALAPSNAWG